MAARFPLAETCAVLVEVCTEINCPISEQEIRHPTPAKVQTVYEAWMTKFLEINIEDCVRVAQEQLDQMDYHVRTFAIANRAFCLPCDDLVILPGTD